MPTATKTKKYVVSFLVEGQGRKYQVMTTTGVTKLMRLLRKSEMLAGLSVQDAPESARVGRVWWDDWSQN